MAAAHAASAGGRGRETCLSPALPLSGGGGVGQAGDAAHGVVDAVALEPAAAQDLAGPHPDKDALRSCADLIVRAVVLPLPAGQRTGG